MERSQGENQASEGKSALRDATAMVRAPTTMSLEKPPDLDPFFEDLTRAKSAKELKEHLETRVL